MVTFKNGVARAFSGDFWASLNIRSGCPAVGLSRNFMTNFREIPSAAIAEREGRLRYDDDDNGGDDVPPRDPLMQTS